jgi:hypothetical protein
MAAGLVSHNYTTAAGVTFGVLGWVPNTASPDVDVKPAVLLMKSDGTLADPTLMESYLSRLLSSALPKAAGAATATTGFLIGGTYNSTPITVTDTQQAGLQIDANGFLKINIAALDGANDNGRTAAANSAPMVLSDEDLAAINAISGRMSNAYEYVAASASAQILGATGAVGDFLSHVTITPETTSPGAVSITDGNGTARVIFTGGASSVSNLVPFTVAIGAACVNSTTPGWKITTGADVHCIGFGNFT